MMSTSLRVHFQVRTRIIKLLNELKLVQRKFCLHEDPVKESMEFSQESTQAAQDMANVELIELRTSKIHQCPSCGHAVFKETILCTCVKLIRPNQEMIQRIRAAFHILKALSFRTSSVSSRGQKHGHQLWQLPAAEAKCLWTVFSAAGILISLTSVVLPGIKYWIALEVLGETVSRKVSSRPYCKLLFARGRRASLSFFFFCDGLKWCWHETTSTLSSECQCGENFQRNADTRQE